MNGQISASIHDGLHSMYVCMSRYSWMERKNLSNTDSGMRVHNFTTNSLQKVLKLGCPLWLYSW